MAPTLKPEQVILVVSPKMKKQAGFLTKVLTESGIRVVTQPLSDEHDYRLMESELLELASALEADEVTLNVTGGTKLMSLAAQKVAEVSEWKLFYVDVDTDRVIWLHRDAPPAQALTEQLRLRQYLQGYGFSLPHAPQGMQVTPARQQLIDTLLRQIGSLEAPLSQLNWLAQIAEDKKCLNEDMNERQREPRSLEALLRHFEEAGCLKVERDCIQFCSEEDRDFVKGGWLEAHVFRSVVSLNKAKALGIRESAANLEVCNDQGVKNELDVAFMARNRLFVIECKTARMDKPEAPKANDTLFKLAEIGQRIGGLGTHRMLASYRALGNSERMLAKALGIELVCGTELLHLDEKIKAWVRV
jgi:hypothetical protein